MNILVTGSNGQLGSEIRALSPRYEELNFFFTTKAELDVTDKQAIEKYVADHDIESIINCAAYTAVDKAESEPELADLVNHLAVNSLAEVSKAHDVRLIHISTDYVFDGKGYRPYLTDHPTAPVNKYGETKLKGELAIKKVNPANSMIIRTSWVYSSFGNNFVKTMLELGRERNELNVITDQIGVPTYARDLALFIVTIALYQTNENVNTYHYTNAGACSWYDFAKEIITKGNLHCIVKPITSEKYPTPAKRPYYSIMDTSDLVQKFSFEIPYWKDSLNSCLQKIAYSQSNENIF